MPAIGSRRRQTQVRLLGVDLPRRRHGPAEVATYSMTSLKDERHSLEAHSTGNDEHTFTPLSDDDARKLFERHANHLVEQYFGPFPEYGSAERRLTVRIPIGLARRVEAAAEAQKLNLNKFIQRTLEKAVASAGRPPAII
jgi:predicted DNA binding CopG/RHH family protein